MFIKNNSCHAEIYPQKRTTRAIAVLNLKQFRERQLTGQCRQCTYAPSPASLCRTLALRLSPIGSLWLMFLFLGC
jgi:hypothetical protein